MWLHSNPGDEGWLALVNTHCRHLKGEAAQAGCRGSDDHTGLTSPAASSVTSPPGEVGSARPSPQPPPHNPVSLAGDAKTTFKACHRQFLGPARPSRSTSASLFTLSEVTANSRLLPGGLCTGSFPGTKVGTVWGSF